ncbi:MAG: cryptochrome/photolyase family protein, partial [Pseudomonas sp.]|nr:cryptochrome/photolyase family protein [Pseudomonas sp.]
EGRKPSQLIMDRHYRSVRKETGILMEGSQPAGGQFSVPLLRHC